MSHYHEYYHADNLRYYEQQWRKDGDSDLQTEHKLGRVVPVETFQKASHDINIELIRHGHDHFDRISG